MKGVWLDLFVPGSGVDPLSMYNLAVHGGAYESWHSKVQIMACVGVNVLLILGLVLWSFMGSSSIVCN